MPKTKKKNENRACEQQPMGWDLSKFKVLRSLWRVSGAYQSETERSKAAAYLVKEWKKKNGGPPQLVDILTAWWVAARQETNVADDLGRWGESPADVYRQAMGKAAVEFADAMVMPVEQFVKEMDQMGLPRSPMYICGCSGTCAHPPV